MKVEVDVLGSPSLYSPYGLCGRKATLNLNWSKQTSGSCVKLKVEVAVLGSPSPISLNLFFLRRKVALNVNWTNQTSGAV